MVIWICYCLDIFKFPQNGSVYCLQQPLITFKYSQARIALLWNEIQLKLFCLLQGFHALLLLVS
ncbi:hypothetical protein WS95_23550 [Burkholderia sp. MSMB1826]|nr:hypothetical protein WS95_23550 [Burkholderia sp. MSMB1826]